MLRGVLFTFLLSLLLSGLYAQNLELVGRAKITVMDTVTDVSANIVRQSDGTLALRQYKIGDLAQGGIIFYIDESGEHGLAADTADVGEGIRWYAGEYGITQAKRDGPFAGKMNTSIIISSQVAIGDDGDPYAARLCAELQRGGYGDWYLPSKEELNLMYQNKATIEAAAIANGGSAFAPDWYWSSTESMSNLASMQNFGVMTQQVDDFKRVPALVRAIQAF